MSNDRQRLVESLFLEAAELPEETRGEFLAVRCAGDGDLRREVESLLGAHDGGDGLLDEPQPMTIGLMQQLSGLLRVDDASIPPTGKIGAYKVIRVLGSGGMGVVYLAEQERPKRTVALKVIRRGLATASLLRRFEHEAEILGRLHHAGIAQIYEAGVSDDGFGPQPYIAMEYINGRPLTEHASIYRLGIREKLLLMARTCEAVQHAHQRGVIHRDLKPGNILVQAEETESSTESKVEGGTTAIGGTTLGLSGVGLGGVGEPKVLDFGVARIADNRAGAGLTTMGTNVGQLIGTLAYMSPEQLVSGGREVDTRSDVYALGVVLFQLLTGKLPYDVTQLALPEAVRRIKDDPPMRLSVAGREYRGDLETIVSKAIEKEKGRRYQSAAELGADLHRFLLGEAIWAKRDSALYVLHKQMLRYKTIVGAAAIGVIALASFAVYAAVSAERFKTVAASEKFASEAAQREKDRADAAAKKLQQELFAANVERGRLEGVSGKVVVAEEFLWSEFFRDPKSPHAHWALWELYEKNPCRWTVQGPERTQCSALNADTTLLAVGAMDRSVVLMDTETGAVVSRIADLPGVPMSISFEPTGERVLIGLNNGAACVARIDGPDTPEYLADPMMAHEGAVRAVVWSPDGRFLATGGGDKRIKIWDAASLGRVADWLAHSQGVCALAFDPATTRLASGSNETGSEARLRIWSVSDWSPAAELDARQSPPGALTFSADGKQLACAAYDRFTLIYNIDAGTSRVLPSKYSGPGNAIAFSPDGKRILGCGGGETIVWMVEQGAELMKLGQHRDDVIGAAWTKSGRALSVSRDGAVKSWEVRRAIPMRGAGIFKSWCFGTAYSTDGSRLAIGSGDGTIVIQNPETRERLQVIPTGREMRTRPVRFTPDNKRILAGCADGLIRIFNVADGAELKKFGAAGKEIFALALMNDGKTLASAHADARVRLWDLETGAPIRELKDPRLVNRVEGVDFSPDGKLMVCSGLEKGVLVWNTQTWEPVRALEGLAQAWPVAFSADGKMIAAGTWGDNVELWEVSTFLQIGSLTGHRGLISTIAFSPDGEYIASGGDDATVKLWHLASRRCVLTIETHHGEATGLSFHPNGKRLTTGCQDHAAPSWELSAIDPFINGNMEYQRARFKASSRATGE